MTKKTLNQYVNDAINEEVLREFGEWIKTQPIYVGGGLTDREVLVVRNGKFESAIEVYLKEKKEKKNLN